MRLHCLSLRSQNLRVDEGVIAGEQVSQVMNCIAYLEDLGSI